MRNPTVSPAVAEPASPAAQVIPLGVKVLYTAFLAVLVPYYWVTYGPTNFLYFCDVALFLGLVAVWTERAIFASIAAVGITGVQLLWQVDFLGTLFSLPVFGLTGYMFNSDLSLFVRGLSFFHFWLPIFLMYLVWRLGYDRRALVAWTFIAWSVMLISYGFLPGPGDVLTHPDEPHNVNYVYGLGEQPQTWVSPTAWLAMMMLGLPLLICTPTHFLLKFLFRQPGESTDREWSPSVAG